MSEHEGAMSPPHSGIDPVAANVNFRAVEHHLQGYIQDLADQAEEFVDKATEVAEEVVAKVELAAKKAAVKAKKQLAAAIAENVEKAVLPEPTPVAGAEGSQESAPANPEVVTDDSAPSSDEG